MKMTENDIENLTEIVSIERGRGKTTLFKNVNNKQYPYIARYDYPGNNGATLIWGCEDLKKGRLVLGMFLRMKETFGSDKLDRLFDYNGDIPIPIAVVGQNLIAAYLKIVEDPYKDQNTRDQIAGMMDVTKQTVSNYLNRVRWDGCTDCGSEHIEKKTLNVDSDEVQIAECYDCNYYYVIPEDLEKQQHEKLPTENYPSDPCVDELEPAVGKHGNDEFRLWCCVSCGFYTVESSK